ncbi:uncharacterized protein LOC128966435 [Oppia nitens]|uniref:uncharacterized protein LOC128966435 n=1 Tax=Oppia nitens TaxID=1686743 RepID=UPI0023DC67B0|nr:uncharacterized protein LOC128966435 [Oppia nitens]
MSKTETTTEAKTSSKTESTQESKPESKSETTANPLDTTQPKTPLNSFEGLVFGLGNPLLDISANVEPEFLKKYSLLANDQILATEKHKNMCKDMIEKYKMDYSAGGSIQNTLRVMQWFFQKVPNVATYMGCIGNDGNGKIMESEAKNNKINAIYLVDKTVSTGVCACLITDNGKNRSLIAYLGASLKFNIQHMLTNYQFVQKAKYIITSGYHLTVSFESIMNLAKHCETNDKIFLFCLSAPYVSTKHSKELLQLYPYIDYLFANESESREFSEMMNWSTHEIKEIASLMADKDIEKKKRGRKVIITQGRANVLLAYSGDPHIKEFDIIKVSQNKVIDTNGAGDAFVGGFLAQLICDKTIDVCIKCGNYAASEVIQQSGCKFPKVNKFKI